MFYMYIFKDGPENVKCQSSMGNVRIVECLFEAKVTKVRYITWTVSIIFL